MTLNRKTRDAIEKVCPEFVDVMRMQIRIGTDHRHVLDLMQKHIGTGDVDAAERLQQPFRDIAMNARKEYQKPC